MKLDTMEAWKAYEAYDADLRVAVLQGEQRATISNIVTDMIEEVPDGQLRDRVSPRK